ncbi:MAG: enoyl-CoA hydratase/isomerase family protein [Deltaproteobacteria bacterium]|nr:enoyl-CoA hydratase/isomerase family protein [Deltaproteobacteria bacterium]
MTMHNVLMETRGAIGLITLNRPKQLNALNAETMREIIAAARECENNPEIKVVVITGSGEKAFAAGADIKAMATMGFAEADAYGRLGHDCMRVLEELKQPVIAAVNGYALGGGTELALACDFIYAADSAVFALPEVKLGLFPGWGGTQRLSRIVGRPKANELIFTGKRLTAPEAYQWGFVNHVVPKAELWAAVEQVAQEIAANAPLAIACAKRVIIQSCHLSLADGLALERSTFPSCFTTEDAREGLAAFMEGRVARFVGK